MTTPHLTRARLEQATPVLAPLVLDALCARLATRLGFEALYLGGGAMGYAKSVLEANLTLTEMASAGLDITSACPTPLLLDAAAGWGDPMHVHRSVRVAEGAGFAGIEIEDQILPKRAHHHVGIEHMVAPELMAAKIAEAVRARRDPDFLIIARTNAVRATDRDDAVRRLEACKRAGADLLLALPRTPEDLRFVAERLPPPLAWLCPPGGLAGVELDARELGALGYRLLCDPQTVLLAQFEAARAAYEALARDGAAPPPAGTTWRAIGEAVHDVIDIERLLEIERRTVERGP